MQADRRLAFVVILAFTIGVTVSQAPSVFADDSNNPFKALWDSINGLQRKTDSLQAQIDELRAERSLPAPALAAEESAEPFVTIHVEKGEIESQTIINLVVSNDGPASAVGVKLTAFYKMSLFDIISISEEQCSLLPRGIIECYLGTIDANSQKVVTVDADAREVGQESSITADVSSITDDRNRSNNHVVLTFVTAFAEPVAEEPAPPATEQPEEQEQPADNGNSTSSEATPADSDVASNQTGTLPDAGSEQPSGNSTSSEDSVPSESEDAEEQQSEESQEQAGSSEAESTEENGEEQQSEGSVSSENESSGQEEQQEDESSPDEGDAGSGSESEQPADQ